MRTPIAILVVAGLLGCAQQQAQDRKSAAIAAGQGPAAFVPPPPTPPEMRAPVCVRPSEKQAVAISALISELQVITTTCHTEEKYNALIPKLRPALANNEKVLNSFFARAYGGRAQRTHDEYITELANLQSDLGLRSGDQFCALYGGMLDDVIALPDDIALSRYATTKPIQQAIAVTDCK